MRKSKFTDEQIAFALKQAELGTSVDEVCRKMGISEATYYVWRKKYAGVGPSELRRRRVARKAPAVAMSRLSTGLPPADSKRCPSGKVHLAPLQPA